MAFSMCGVIGSLMSADFGFFLLSPFIASCNQCCRYSAVTWRGAALYFWPAK